MIERASTMSPTDAEEYTAATEQTLDGVWRHIWLGVRLGVPEALGMDDQAWARRLSANIRLPRDERREAVAEMAAEGMSNVAIAATLGVDEGTVRNDKRGDSENSERNGRVVRNGAGYLAEESENSEPDSFPPDDPLTLDANGKLPLVDFETGEIVAQPKPVPDPEIPAELEATDEPVLDLDGTAYGIATPNQQANIDRSNFLFALSKSVARISSIPAEWEAERVAEVIDPELKKSIDINVANLARWAERIDRAMPRGLHVVKREA